MGKQWTFEEIEAIGDRMLRNPKRVIEKTTQVKFEPPDNTLWRAKAIVDLYEWMAASNDYDKTIKTWAAVYIRCGTCARGFSAWYESCEVGPEDNLPAWLESAKNVVLKNRWI